MDHAQDRSLQNYQFHLWTLPIHFHHIHRNNEGNLITHSTVACYRRQTQSFNMATIELDLIV